MSIYDDFTDSLTVSTVLHVELIDQFGSTLAGALSRIAYRCDIADYVVRDDKKYYRMKADYMFPGNESLRTRKRYLKQLKELGLVESVQHKQHYYYRLTNKAYKMSNKNTGIKYDFLLCVEQTLDILTVQGVPKLHPPGAKSAPHTIYIYLCNYVYVAATGKHMDKYKDDTGMLIPAKWHLFYAKLFNANYHSKKCKDKTKKMPADMFEHLVVYTLITFASYALDVMISHPDKSPKNADTFIGAFEGALEDWDDEINMFKSRMKIQRKKSDNGCKNARWLVARYKELGIDITIKGETKNDNLQTSRPISTKRDAALARIEADRIELEQL